MDWFRYVNRVLVLQAGHAWRARLAIIALLVISLAAKNSSAQLTGELGAHDPSTVIKEGANYFYFATGPGIQSRSSTNGASWAGGPSVFAAPPAWTTQAVPSFSGSFWAPDVAYFNGKYHLYYSVSTWGTIDSAIGVAESPSLVNPVWTDQGKVVQSDAVWEAGPNTDTTGFNAIDPSVMVDPNGSVWMAFGSYSSGILVTQLNPATGKRLNTATLSATLVANNAPGGGWGSSIEGASLVNHGGFYYLLVNYGGCCSGVDSTYNIRVGRGTSPTGPFYDKNGVDMRNGGGTIFLEDDGKFIGPGHFSRFTDNGQDFFSYHYYNGDAVGAPTFNMHKLFWNNDWPSYAAVNPDWKGTLDSRWGQSGNWWDGVIPNGVGHIANFGNRNSSRSTIQLDGTGRTVGKVNFYGAGNFTVQNTGQTLTLDADAGEDATINANAGSHTIAAPITAIDRLGVNVATDARLTLSGAVTGAGLTKYGHGTLAVDGTSTFGDTVFIKWGTLEVNGSVTANQYTSVGQIVGENATMIVRGTGSYTASGDLNIADSGNATDASTGTLYIHDNANVTLKTTGGFYVGSGFFANTKAEGIVNQDGGTLTANGSFDGAFIIGGRGSSLASGVYNLSAGAVNANTNVRVGGYGTGTVNQSGGVFTSNSYVSIGRYAGSAGIWNISGGQLNVNNAGRWLLVGESGAGTLDISGSGQVTTANVMRVGHAGGSGVIKLNGGKLTTAGIQRGSGSATINFNGGTLSPSTDTATFLQGLTSAKIQAGGAVIDTNGKTITIGQPLVHDSTLGGTKDGGLTKSGAGALTLIATNTYTGATTVSAGVLNVNGSITSATTVIGGLLGGTGTIAGNVVVNAAGSVGAGTSVESLNITGTFSQSGKMIVELAGGGASGAGAGTQYDLVAVTGNGTLASGSTIDVDLVGFNPSSGKYFDVLTALDINGAGNSLAGVNFDYSGAALAAGLTWQESIVAAGASEALRLSVRFLGDADGNNEVNFDDLGILLNSYNQPGTFDSGDFDKSGKVDFNDLGLLLNNYNHQAPLVAASSPVPEPNTLFQLACGAIAIFMLAARQRRR